MRALSRQARRRGGAAPHAQTFNFPAPRTSTYLMGRFV
jgi:hypothetical protein